MIPGEGPIPCAWLVLGEAPGAAEEKAGRPFVGRSGSLLRDALRAGGVEPEEVYITNAYKLRPAGNRSPTSAELRSHDHYLRDELVGVAPARVLATGNIPLHVLSPGSPGVSKVRGSWIECDTYLVMPTWHPAYVNRNPKEKETFFKDVRNFLA